MKIDTMDYQKKIVYRLVQKQADYPVAVKEDRDNLYQSMRQLFRQAFAVASPAQSPANLKNLKFRLIPHNRITKKNAAS